MIRQAVKSGGDIFVADLISKTLGFLLISGLTFLLSPEDLGKYNALFTAMMSLFIFSGWGVPIVLQRQSASAVNEDKEVRGQVIAAGLVIMVISILVLTGVLFILNMSIWDQLFPGLDQSLLSWVPLLTLLYFCVQAPLSILLGLGKFRSYAMRSAAEAVISLICIVTGALQWGLKGAIFGLLAALLVNTIITVTVLHRAFLAEKIMMSLRHFRERVGYLLREGSAYFIGNTLMGAIANIVMISLFAKHIGYDEFGFLRVAMSVTAIIAVVPNAAKTVTITYIAKFREASTYLKSLQIRYLFFALIVTTVLMSLFLEPVVSLLFGDKYMEGMPVYRMILYLNVIFNMQQILNGFIVGHGLLRYSGIVSTVVVCIFIALMIVCIPEMGMVGYYVAFAACYVLGLIVLIQSEITADNYPDERRLKTVLYADLLFLLILTSIVLLPLSIWQRIGIELGLLICYVAGHAAYAFPSEEVKRIYSTLLTKLRPG